MDGTTTDTAATTTTGTTVIDPHAVYNVTSAAAVLQISRTTCYQLLNDQLLNGVPVGSGSKKKTWRILGEYLISYLKSPTAKAVSKPAPKALPRKAKKKWAGVND